MALIERVDRMIEQQPPDRSVAAIMMNRITRRAFTCELREAINATHGPVTPDASVGEQVLSYRRIPVHVSQDLEDDTIYIVAFGPELT